jgi:hypothetical protein
LKFFPHISQYNIRSKRDKSILIQAALTLGAKRDSWFLFKEVVLPEPFAIIPA